MHIDPRAKKECRYRVNLDHYQAAAIDALAAVHRTQPASYLREIIEAHLDSLRAERHENSIDKVA